MEDTNKLSILAAELLRLRSEKDRLKRETDENSAQIEETQAALWDLMTEVEIPSFAHGGFNFAMKEMLFASPHAENKEQVYDWLKENGYGDLVKETVNANTFTSLIREMYASAESQRQELLNDGVVPEEIEEMVSDLPPDLEPMVNVYKKPTIGVTKKR